MSYRGGVTEEEILRQIRDYGGLRSRSLAKLTMSSASEVQKLIKKLENEGKIEKDYNYIRMREAIWIIPHHLRT